MITRTLAVMVALATVTAGPNLHAADKPVVARDGKANEEHPWQFVKSEADKASTMKRLGGTWPHAPNGKCYLRIENRSASETVALAQDGIWVNSGAPLDFSGLLCDGTMFSATPISANPVAIEVTLFPEGRLNAEPLTRATVVVDATTCRRFTVQLPAPATTGRATFALRVPPKSTLVCDNLSLQPADRGGAIRKEVIEGMKRVPASVIRFPGGCFASTYRWRDGIGDRDGRPVDFLQWCNFPNPITQERANIDLGRESVALEVKPFSATSVRIRRLK